MPSLCSFLENSDFSHCFLSCDVDHVWSSIKLIIQQAMDLFIPKVKLRSHQFPKWFTPDIRHRLNCLRTLRRKCRTHPTAHNLSKLLLLESNLDADISSVNQDMKLISFLSSLTLTAIIFSNTLEVSLATAPFLHL